MQLQAEGVNAAAIATEKTRAEGVEAGLRTDVDSNQAQITANDSDILALQILQASDHNDNQAQITAEVNRATAAEGVLQSNIDAEQARAEGIESGLRTDVDSVQRRLLQTILTSLLYKTYKQVTLQTYRTS